MLKRQLKTELRKLRALLKTAPADKRAELETAIELLADMAKDLDE